MGGIISRAAPTESPVAVAATTEMALQRTNQEQQLNALKTSLARHPSLTKQGFADITPNDSDIVGDELVISKNLSISRLALDAIGITHDIEGIKMSAIKLCAMNEFITPKEGSAIVFMCLKSHRFHNRAIMNNLANQMANMTFELTTEYANGVITITELHVILESICTMIEENNTMWK